MDSNSIPLSLDQEQAFKTVSMILERAGINFTTGKISNQIAENKTVHALIGRAGSGKTALLSSITEKMLKVGVEIISGDFEVNKNKNKRTLSVLAPTNKAANILRMRGVPATTIHRILYTPVYDPDYEKIVEWLIGERDEKPSIEGISEISLKRAWEFYSSNKSIPGALAAAGLKGSDFISGWKRREEPLDIGFIDESSMLDDDQLNDLKEIFSTLILFGDPAQLAPISQSGQMVFDKFSPDKKSILSQIHRQKSDNPILKLSNVFSTVSPVLGFFVLNFAPLICFDIAFSNTVRKSNKSSYFMINISNDTWFGESIGPYHHLDITRVRAIENNKWIIRSTNDGSVSYTHLTLPTTPYV